MEDDNDVQPAPERAVQTAAGAWLDGGQSSQVDGSADLWSDHDLAHHAREWRKGLGRRAHDRRMQPSELVCPTCGLWVFTSKQNRHCHQCGAAMQESESSGTREEAAPESSHPEVGAGAEDGVSQQFPAAVGSAEYLTAVATLVTAEQRLHVANSQYNGLNQWQGRLEAQLRDVGRAVSTAQTVRDSAQRAFLAASIEAQRLGHPPHRALAMLADVRKP